MMERVLLNEIMKDFVKANTDQEVIDKDGKEIELEPLDLEKIDLLTSDCNVIDHICPLSTRTELNKDETTTLKVFFLFRTRSYSHFIVEADYKFDKNPNLTKLFENCTYNKLINDRVFDYILDSYKDQTVHIDMKFEECENNSEVFVLPCLDELYDYKALFINRRQLAQLSFIDNYFLYLNMNDRCLNNILKEFENDNIFDYKVTCVNGIEKVAKAGKHTIACMTSLECELEDKVQDIHLLSSHDCGAKVKRTKTNCSIKELNNTFGKSRREFIVEYITNVNMNDKETLLIRAKNLYYGDVIFRFDEYQKSDFMEMLENKTNMK